MQPAFSYSLNYHVLPKTVAFGCFDGVNSTLCSGSANGKIYLHSTTADQLTIKSNDARLSAEENTNVLNVSHSIRVVTVGRLNPTLPRDVIVVGTPTHVLAYDVETNAELFYREVPDGVNDVVIGQNISNIEGTVLLCGGNCVLQGFNHEGSDVFWTVTGDTVKAMCLNDFDCDGKMEILVGSDDFEIRVFKGDAILCEITETESITHLCNMGRNNFAYALSNGTVGVYEGNQRLWRIKSKHFVHALSEFDLCGDGDLKLVTGWSNGKIDFRKLSNGEVIMKDQLSSAVAGLVHSPAAEKQKCIVCCSVDGEVRGFLQLSESRVVQIQKDPNEDILRDLQIQKQNLVLEIANYQENTRVIRANDKLDTNRVTYDLEHIGAIPASTQLQTTLYVSTGSNVDQPCVELFVSTSNETVIRCVMLFAEGIFAGESLVVHPTPPAAAASSLKVQLRPASDLAVDLHVKALVGHRQSLQFHVFELDRSLPKFAFYAVCNESAPMPASFVSFAASERPERLLMWINENFLLQEELLLRHSKVDVRFFSLRGAGMLFLQMDAAAGQIYVRCDDIAVCGEIVQTIAEFFGIVDLRSVAEFPLEIEALTGLLNKVNELYDVRDRLMAEVADLNGLAKGLLVRAEDAQICDDIPAMRRYYAEAYGVSQQIIAQQKIRCGNQEELKHCLKQINLIIQRAGKLRVGQPKTDVINACRRAIKEDTAIALLPKLIRLGV